MKTFNRTVFVPDGTFGWKEILNLQFNMFNTTIRNMFASFKYEAVPFDIFFKDNKLIKDEYGITVSPYIA